MNIQKSNNVLTVGEHDLIYVSDRRDIAKRQISYDDMQILTHIDFNVKSTDKQVFKQIGRNLKTQSFVGSIQIDKDLIIEILPKFIKTDKELDDKAIQQYRETLMNMIMLSGDSKFVSSSNITLKSQTGELPMFEALIYFFADALSKELRKGLHREYIKTSGNLNQMKGRLVLNEHLRRNMFDQAKLYVEYETFSIDNPLMQIFKSSVRLLLDQHQIGAITKQKLNEALYLLNDVADIRLSLKDFETVVFHRMNSRFEDLFAQCRFLIMKLFPFSITADSKTKFWSILFDMDELFENFLAYLFNRSEIAFEDQFSFHAYRAPLGCKNVGGRPDFVFYQGSSIASVADAKWKLYDPAREASSNMGGLDWANFWQLTSYMYLLGKEPIPGYFIVPAKSKDVPREVHYPSPRDYHADIVVLTIDFTMPIRDILETHRFSWDEKNCLRLSSNMTAKLWVERLLGELDKVRLVKVTSVMVIDDDAFYPYLAELKIKSGVEVVPVAHKAIEASEEMYIDASTHVRERFGDLRTMDGFPYAGLVNDLIEKLSPPPVKDIIEDANENDLEDDSPISWTYYEATIDRLYDSLDSRVEYSRSIYAANLAKIKSGELSMPVVDVKHFSINNKKIAIFHFEKNSITVNFENFDASISASAKLKKDKLLKIASGLNYATAKDVKEWSRFLIPLENYLSARVEKEIGTMNPIEVLIEVSKEEPKEDEMSPSAVETVLLEKAEENEKPEKEVSEVAWFKTTCEQLAETLSNPNYRLNASVKPDKSMKNMTNAPDTNRTLTIGSKKLCTLTRLSDSLLIELDNIDDGAYFSFLQDKTPFTINNLKAQMSVGTMEQWNGIKGGLFKYLNKAVVNAQNNSLFDEIKPPKKMYSPQSTLKKLDSEPQRYSKIYKDPYAFKYFTELDVPTSQKSISAHKTIIERFVDSIAKDGVQLAPNDTIMTTIAFDLIDSHPQAFKNFITRDWALQKLFDEKIALPKLKPDMAAYIADRMKESKKRIVFNDTALIEDAIKTITAKTNYSNAVHILAMAAASDLSECPYSLTDRIVDAAESYLPTSSLVPSLMLNETTPLLTVFGYYFSRSFYKGQISLPIVSALSTAHERLTQHSKSMMDFIDLIERRTNNYESNRGDWLNFSQSEIAILLSLGEYISKSKKLFFLWKSLSMHTTDIDQLENIYDNVGGLSNAQRRIVFNSIIRAKIYRSGSSFEALARFGDLLHKILVYEDSMQENKNIEIIHLIAKNYSKNEVSARFLFEYYREDEVVFEELIKYSNVRSGEESDLIIEYVKNRSSLDGLENKETELALKLKSSLNH